MTLPVELLADSRALLYVQERADRALGELSPEDSWLTNHLQITMVASLTTERTTQVRLLVEHVIDEPQRLVEWSHIVEGEARRDSKDKQDPTTGVLLATSRALQKAVDIIERQANGRVKHADDMRVQKKHQKAKRQLRSLMAKLDHGEHPDRPEPAPKRIFGRRVVSR